MSLLVKLAGHDLPSWELVFARSLGNMLFNFVAIVLTRLPFKELAGPAHLRPTLLARSFFGFAGLSCIYYSLTVLVLSEATTLAFTAPVWCGVLSIVVLREKWHVTDAAASLLALVGVVLVARPPFLFPDATAAADAETARGEAQASATETAGRGVGIAAALAGSLFAAAAYISVRRLGGRVHTLVVTHWFCMTSVVVSPVLLVLTQRPVIPASSDTALWLEIVGLGAAGFFGQILLNQGMQIEKAGPASAMRFLDIVFVFIWEAVLLGGTPSPWSVVGACVVTLSTLSIAVRKWITSRAAPSPERAAPGDEDDADAEAGRHTGDAGQGIELVAGDGASDGRRLSEDDWAQIGVPGTSEERLKGGRAGGDDSAFGRVGPHPER